MPDSKPLAAKAVPVESVLVSAWYMGGCSGVAGRFPSGRLYECEKGNMVMLDETDFVTLASSDWTLDEPVVIPIPAVTNGASKEKD